MTDVIKVALERRARLEAEIVRLNEFVSMATTLVEWSEGRRLLPAVSIISSGPRAVAARDHDARDMAPRALAATGAAPSPGRRILPAENPEALPADGSFAAFAERVAEALNPQSQALALRYDETSTSLAVPEQFGRIRDGALARLDCIRASLSRGAGIGRLAAWLRDTATRAFRDDETATSDIGELARSASAGAATVIEMRARVRPSPRPVDAYVGQRLRQRRWMTGLTREQLAEMAGFECGEIAGYETGDAPVVASRLWEIAAALDVPVAYFFDGATGQAAENDEAQAGVLPDDEALELIRAYYAIPEDQRPRLWDLARLLRQAA